MKIFHFHNVMLLRSNVMPPIEDLLATVLDAARVLGPLPWSRYVNTVNLGYSGSSLKPDKTGGANYF